MFIPKMYTGICDPVQRKAMAINAIIRLKDIYSTGKRRLLPKI